MPKIRFDDGQIHMSLEERRTSLRYRDPVAKTVSLSVEGGETGQRILGLMLNECYGGIACVYVGSPLEVGSRVTWQEYEGVSTVCTVTRCQEIHRDVYLLALKIDE